MALSSGMGTRVHPGSPSEQDVNGGGSVPPAVVGKFLQAGGERLWLKGVTYGTFAPDATGRQFPTPDRLAADFAAMRRHGINTIRTYTAPDESMLDAAEQQHLRVMAGVAWPHHVPFLDDRRSLASVRREIMTAVRALHSHPAVVLVALGNEIPASVVRWLGRTRVERFLRDLHAEARSIAPETLFTYVNYPPTDYLDLSFVDVLTFNVYLHREAELRAYLARLQNIAADKPLLVAEAGADSLREGLTGQAELTSMQIRAAFTEGACGAIAFAWTDEWWRGGEPISDWAFGLVDAERHPKPALQSVAETFSDAPFQRATQQSWPTVSIVVCAHDAADTIDECLESLARLTYPRFEVLVVNDGSQDDTGDRARRHSLATVIDITHGGLSVARNVGLEAATGEIVAYTDADTRVDPDWLTYLVQPFLSSDVVGAGGPNVVPPDDPWLAQCVARAPGGPTHVLLDDRTAEHVPGCNMAFRRDALQAIGGFNPIYVRAGDDVDVCWRLQQRGWKIRFSPAALVWHHHRAGLRDYWRQQVGYGEGQAWLRPYHPDKFAGRRIAWRGHVYSPLPFVRALSRPRLNTGIWGTAAFPSVYRVHAHPLAFLPHLVRWQVGCVALILAGLVTTVAAGYPPALALTAMGAAGLGVTIARCVRHAFVSDIESLPAIRSWSRRSSQAIYRAVIAWLHLIQPFARTAGELRGALSPARVAPTHAQRTLRASVPSLVDLGRALYLIGPRTIESQFWSERWISSNLLLTRMLERFRESTLTRTVGVDDGWQTDRDMSIAAGPFAWLDVRILVEDHGPGRHVIRFGRRLRAARLFLAAALGAVAGTGVWAQAGLDVSTWIGAATSGVLILSLLAAVVWRTARTLASTDRITANLATELHMSPIPARHARPHDGTRTAGSKGRPARLPLLAADGTLGPNDTAAVHAREPHIGGMWGGVPPERSRGGAR